MSVVSATRAMAEKAARQLAEAIADDDRFASAAVDTAERAPGRWQVTVYFDNDDNGLASALENLAPGWTWQVLPQTDWVAKSQAALAPVRAGRFLVYGEHDSHRRRPNDVGLAIPAAEAFGTGHHGSTQGCLLAIEATVKTREIRTALDLGTGSGILAIAVAKLAKATVLATDIDPVALRVARQNARANSVAARVTVRPAMPLAMAAATPVDLVVANILAEPLVALAPTICRSLAPGGTVILSGLLPAQRRRIVAAYRMVGLTLVGWQIVDGWATVRMERRRQNAPAR